MNKKATKKARRLYKANIIQHYAIAEDFSSISICVNNRVEKMDMQVFLSKWGGLK